MYLLLSLKYLFLVIHINVTVGFEMMKRQRKVNNIEVYLQTTTWLVIKKAYTNIKMR